MLLIQATFLKYQFNGAHKMKIKQSKQNTQLEICNDTCTCIVNKFYMIRIQLKDTFLGNLYQTQNTWNLCWYPDI